MTKRYFTKEKIVNLLDQIQQEVESGSHLSSACRSVGVSDTTYYNWRKRYGENNLQETQAATHLKNRD